MKSLAGIAVVASALFLLGLAVTILIASGRAERFLNSFASSARAHYTEQILRLLAGLAFVGFASEMRHPRLFLGFGWLLIVTASGLLLVPWRWHRRFAEWSVPLAIRYKRFLAMGAFGLGGLILYAIY